MKTLEVDNLTYDANMIRRMESAHAREHEELETLKKKYAEHLELDADENTEFQAKYNMRVSERNAALRQRDELQARLDSVINYAALMQQNDSDAFAFIVASAHLPTNQNPLKQMVDELIAVDMGDSEVRIRIYAVLNKYHLL